MAEREAMSGLMCFRVGSQLGARRPAASLKKGSWLTSQQDHGFGRVAVEEVTELTQSCVTLRTEMGAVATVHYRSAIKGTTGRKMAKDSLGHDVMVMRSRSFGFERIVSVELKDSEPCLVVMCGGATIPLGDSESALLFVGPAM